MTGAARTPYSKRNVDSDPDGWAFALRAEELTRGLRGNRSRSPERLDHLRAHPLVELPVAGREEIERDPRNARGCAPAAWTTVASDADRVPAEELRLRSSRAGWGRPVAACERLQPFEHDAVRQ
jgi:hypothetical protein